MHMVFARSVLACAATLAATVLCAADEKAAKTGTISGNVTYQGKPLPAGIITFHTADGKALAGAIQSDGTYSVAKVPVGRVRVAVTTEVPKPKPRPEDKPKPPGEKDAPAKVIPIPAKYADPNTSGIVVTVVEGKQTVDIKLD
jgi:hypothetical protein